MIDLDNQEQVSSIDQNNVLGSVEALGKQLKDAWGGAGKVEVGEEWEQVNKIIVAGMGGSALGAEVIKSIDKDKIIRPMEIVRDYHLPAYTDRNTLVVLSSYSGTTEETLSCAKEAQKAGAKTMAIASGGDLEDMAVSLGWPFYKIEAKYNPCNQPRMAVGYSIGGILRLLTAAGVVKIREEEIDLAINTLEKRKEEWGLKSLEKNNRVKQMAYKISGKMPIVIAAEHLSGNAKVFCNSMNENAKTLTTYFLLPEANHHLMEGLGFPEAIKDKLIFVFLGSNLYSQEIKTRIRATKEVMEENGAAWEEFTPKDGSQLGEAMETILWGNYLNFYLAMINQIDPSPIPWVDFFKKRMKDLKAGVCEVAVR
jgi:glucose/mannose-6-phosphate isomerase